MKKLFKPGSFLYKLLFSMAVIMVKLWFKTLRVSQVDPNGLNTAESKVNFISVMWHNRLFSVLPLFHKNVRLRSFAMASRSKDGQIISDLLNAFDIETIRGSADKNGKSKGGAAALITCIRALKEGKITTIIPDGPRGPLYEVQPGAIMASIKSGVPVQPISVNCSSCWTISSWDKLQVPKPFSKVELVLGDLLNFEGGLDEKSMLENKQVLKKALMDITVDLKV